MGRHGMAFVVVALAGSLFCPGCGPEIRDRATGVEADYSWDTLEACLDRPIGEVYQAAQVAVQDLVLCVFREAQDGISAEIVAVDAQWERVEITLGAVPGSRTELCIRVGMWGDKNKSIVLFQSILAGLSESGSAPAVSRAPERTHAVAPSRRRQW